MHLVYAKTVTTREVAQNSQPIVRTPTVNYTLITYAKAAILGCFAEKKSRAWKSKRPDLFFTNEITNLL
jgi:hypothetical protein